MLTKITKSSTPKVEVTNPRYLLSLVNSAYYQFAFSLRKLRAAYTGFCLQIRRASDNTTLNIGFVDNYVDLRAIANFCGTSAGYISIWYDQTGKSERVEQPSASAQPMLFDGNVFTFTFNVAGDVVIAPYFDGVDDQLDWSNFPSLVNFNLFVSLRISNSWYNSGYGGIITDGGSGDIFHSSASLGYCYFNGAYNVVFPKSNTVNGLQTITFVHNYPYPTIHVEGFQNRTLGNNVVVSPNSLVRKSLMGNWAGSNLQGHVAEAFAINSQQTSTTRANVQNNMTEFTNQPPSYSVLDLIPNALVAYALYKLRPTYTGNAIRVRRSSDDAQIDIGFDGEGNLNLEQLTNFCGNADGFVTIWYSQAASGNNLLQTTPSRQPQIVFNGNVFYDNGKPAVYYSRAKQTSMYTASNVTASTNICSVFVNNTDIDVSLGTSMALASLGSWGGSSGYQIIPRFDTSAYDWDTYDSAFMGSGYVSGTAPRIITNPFSANPLYRGNQTIVVNRLGGANFIVRNGQDYAPFRVNSVGTLPSYSDILSISTTDNPYQGAIQAIIYYSYPMLYNDAYAIDRILNNYYNAY